MSVCAAVLRQGCQAGQADEGEAAVGSKVAQLRDAYVQHLQRADGTAEPQAASVQSPGRGWNASKPRVASADPHIESALAALRDSGFKPDDEIAWSGDREAPPLFALAHEPNCAGEVLLETRRWRSPGPPPQSRLLYCCKGSVFALSICASCRYLHGQQHAELLCAQQLMTLPSDSDSAACTCALRRCTSWRRARD